MTPSATSPPKMLPKSRIDSVTGLMNSSRNSISADEQVDDARADACLKPVKTKNLPR